MFIKIPSFVFYIGWSHLNRAATTHLKICYHLNLTTVFVLGLIFRSCLYVNKVSYKIITQNAIIKFKNYTKATEHATLINTYFYVRIYTYINTVYFVPQYYRYGELRTFHFIFQTFNLKVPVKEKWKR